MSIDTRVIRWPWIALLFVAACGHESVEQVETKAAVPVTVEEAKVDTLGATIDVTGIVAPAPGAELTVTAPQAARIAELPKSEGEAVKAGDLLVQFDIPTLASDLAARRAEVDQASARLDAAKAAVARLSSLVDRGVAAAREVEEARREQAEATAALSQAQSAVTAAVSLADRATVRATFAGVVARRWHNAGDLVDASASDPVLRVIDPARVIALAAVPVAELPRVAIGHRATVTGPGGGEGEAARVITRPAQVDPDRATADVRLAFASPTKLPAGAAITVSIVAESRPKATIIPEAAVTRDGDETFVMIAGSDAKAHKSPVKLGLSANGQVEVLSGVKAGDQVIVRGQDGLPDGAAVTVQK
jgi:RND family efflux transporter MFP subunit